MKKAVSWIAAVMAVLMICTSCSQTPADTSSQGSSESTETSSATSEDTGSEAQGDVTLTLLESMTSPQRTEIIRTICDKFEEENPGVTVNIISPPLEGADQKIAQMLMAQQEIDVVEVRDQTFAQFSNNGWIAPLNEYVEGWEGMDTLTETAKFYMTAYSDNIYMIPYGLFQKALYYRKDWFEEAGIEVPHTWDEMLDAAIKLTDPAQNRYGYSFRGGQGVGGFLDMIIYGNVGSENVAELTSVYFLKDGKSTMWSTQGAMDAVTLYKRLYEEASPKDSIAWSFSETVQGFVGGTTAMLIQDPEVIATCTSDMEEGTWDVAPLPIGTSGEALVPTGFAGWGITSYTPNADLAAELVLFLSNEENNTYFNEQYSLIPIHTSAAESSVFKDGPFAGYMEMNLNPDVYYPACSPSQYQAFAEYNTSCDGWVQKYLQGDISAEELLKIYDDYWLQALADEGQLW